MLRNIKIAFLLYWIAIVLSFGIMKASSILEVGKLTALVRVKKVDGDMTILLESMSFLAHSPRTSEMAMELSNF